MTIIAVIINGSAGSGHDDEQATSLREKFAAHGMQARVTLASSGDEMIAAARAALDEGLQIVVAGGGDGTINAVASVIAGTGVAFGVLPMGTLNHFAKDVGIPLLLDEAIATIASGARKQVDVGEVNDKIFLNNSSLGLYPDIVRDREKQQNRLGRGKWLAALWATLGALRRYPFISVRLSLDDGTDHARRTPFVFIGNNAYIMQGFSIGARAALDGGKLSLYVAQRPGRLALLRLGWSALCGRLAQERDFDVLSTEKMEIDTRHKRIRVATDGEVTVMLTPLRYRIRPGALSVIVPS
ncbi:diacylglycerol/lipid kinase family protein [Massilia sp. TSP1-1-2]|uniref:diacylglycerol/lipid kinase family protein n=1 Tax=Massilia sp. TSP1-1-2 TaxID=2804649 RepID=UPI003CF11637